MRVHKARGAAYDLDKERQWNWWRPKSAGRRVGPVRQLTAAELRAFAEERGMQVSGQARVADARHK